MTFNKIYFHGKNVIDDWSLNSAYIIVKKSNPNSLDMRYKVNKEFWKKHERPYK